MFTINTPRDRHAWPQHRVICRLAFARAGDFSESCESRADRLTLFFVQLMTGIRSQRLDVRTPPSKYVCDGPG